MQPADDIDPEYGQTLRKVIKSGVKALAYCSKVTPEEVCVIKPVPVVCP